jgi:hypothetical protein
MRTCLFIPVQMNPGRFTVQATRLRLFPIGLVGKGLPGDILKPTFGMRKDPVNLL